MPECCWVEYCPAVMTVETAGLILQLGSNSLDPATWFLMLKQPQSPVCCSRGCIPFSLPEKQVLGTPGFNTHRYSVHIKPLLISNFLSSILCSIQKKIFIFSKIRGITSKMACSLQKVSVNKELKVKNGTQKSPNSGSTSSFLEETEWAMSFCSQRENNSKLFHWLRILIAQVQFP